MTSPASSLASLPAAKRAALLAKYSPAELEALRYDWRFWARPAQCPPVGDWLVWVVLAGRGFGKTRTGAEWVQEQAETLPGSHGALIAKTPADAREVMIEGGESSLLKIAKPWFRPVYEPSKRRIVWPNGTWATIYSSKEYETLRGPQHHWFWADEFCAWHYPQETWDMLMMGLRLGDQPRGVVTTTPKPIGPFRRILADPRTVVTGGSTYDNRANLSEVFFDTVVRRYEGTSLGAQELYAQILDEVPGAMWTRETVARMFVDPAAFDWDQVTHCAVGIDPSTTSEEGSNECGITLGARCRDGHGYLLQDKSGVMPPVRWARQALDLYAHARDQMGGMVSGEAVVVVGETNQGGDMVEQTLRTVLPGVSYRGVWASKSKRARAQPIALLSEQTRVHLVGHFPQLEDELCTWIEDEESPNRLDSFVWTMTKLMAGDMPVPAAPGGDERTSGWRD